jgi:hypothetical protein
MTRVYHLRLLKRSQRIYTRFDFVSKKMETDDQPLTRRSKSRTIKDLREEDNARNEKKKKQGCFVGFLSVAVDVISSVVGVLLYVISAVVSTLLSNAVLLVIAALPLLLMYALMTYGDGFVKFVTGTADLVISFTNVMINAVNQLSVTMPVFGDVWNIIMRVLIKTFGEVDRIIKKGIPETDITGGISKGGFHAPSSYFTSGDIRSGSEVFIESAGLIVDVVVTWIGISIRFIRLAMRLIGSLVCGSDECASVCGYPGCFNFLVAVYWIFSLIYWVFITVGYFFGEVLQTFLDIVKFPMVATGPMRHIVVYILKVLSDFEGVLLATGAWLVNIAFPIPDYIYCSVVPSKFGHQFGTCIFRPPCRAVLQDIVLDILNIKVRLPLRTWICDIFGTVCECARCDWYLGMKVPCMLHPDCRECRVQYSFFYVLFKSLAEKCMVCSKFDVVNDGSTTAYSKADLCPSYCYLDQSAYALAQTYGCPPKDSYRPSYCSYIS